MTDRVTDLLVRIKNASLAKHKRLRVPYFKMGENICRVLSKNGYLGEIKVGEDKKAKTKRFLEIDLLYQGKKPVFSALRLISTPSVRIYEKAKRINNLKSGLGFKLVSTPFGIMTGEEAKKKNLGGEVICEVW